MESSRILGYTEECSGTRDNESGWTTYIASPIQENHHHHDDDDDRSTDKQADYKKGNYNKDDDSESDDSMASDASSGPSNQEIPCTIIEKSVGICSSKHATTKYSSREKLHKQIKQSEGAWPRIKLEKQESVLEAKSAASHVHGGNKLKKTK